MYIQFWRSHSTFPFSFSQTYLTSSLGSPAKPLSCSCEPPAPSTPQTVDYGFKRLVPLLESPALGAGILSITFFFFIACFSDLLLKNTTSGTLGIVVTISSFSILALILFILVLL